MSQARLEANRSNAQLSTGAKTAESKAKCSLNAVKTALTGRTVLLPADDAAEYQRHLAAFEAELQPVGLRECELAQSIADTWWRLPASRPSKWRSSPRAASNSPACLKSRS